MRWVAPTAARRNELAISRLPTRAPPPLRPDQERRILPRLGAGDTTARAMERSLAYSWYPRLVKRKPWCDARWWIPIVRAA